MKKERYDEVFRSHFQGSLEEALGLIERRGEFAGGFAHFASALERVERAEPEYFYTPATQAHLRQAVKILWRALVYECKHRTKLGERMQSHKPPESEIQKAMSASREPSIYGFKVYLKGLPQENQEQWASTARGSVVHKRIISEYLDASTSPIAEVYEGYGQQIAYMGMLYNHTLPNTIKLVKGMAEQLFPETPKWRIAVAFAAPQAKRIPVSAQTVRSEIADYLVHAERSALELAALESSRNKARKRASFEF